MYIYIHTKMRVNSSSVVPTHSCSGCLSNTGFQGRLGSHNASGAGKRQKTFCIFMSDHGHVALNIVRSISALVRQTSVQQEDLQIKLRFSLLLLLLQATVSDIEASSALAKARSSVNVILGRIVRFTPYSSIASAPASNKQMHTTQQR